MRLITELVSTRKVALRLGAICAVALGALLPPAAVGQQSEDAGAGVLGSVDRGETSCEELESDDFEAVGEYVMGRMLGSDAAHEQMDQLMSSMMGSSGEEQMHRFMGERMTGCSSGPAPGGFGGMMGMMGMMGGAGEGGSSFPGMMGGGDGQPYGPGMMGGGSGMMGGGDGQPYGPGMMAAGFDRDDDDGDWDGAAVAMSIGMLALLLVAVAALLIWRPGRRPAGPSAGDLLDQRFARGEIDPQEYERARGALGGP